ncbi:unnamed protein product [Gemmataceae bacterium]|nr:unnamed protein product [Gemmataceae bacterium]VTT97519.1 unnamed protein product [Gemmataceae bacterium]
MNTPASNLGRVAVAAWGACWGVLLASGVVAAHVALTGQTQDQAHPGILESESMASFVRVPWQERYERMWYALVCVAGGLCGGVAVRFVRPSPPLAALGAIAFVVLAVPASASVFTTAPDVARLLLCAGVLALPLAWRVRSVGTDIPVSTDQTSPSPNRIWVTAGVLCLPLAALLYGLLAPHDLAAAAGECYDESHVASYLIGPALYYRDPTAVPGLDFESHYGIGHAHTFSLVMGGHGFEKTMQRYVVFVLVVTVLYLLSGFFVLTDWLQSPWAALGVTLLLLGAVLEGTSYRYPSNWPVRHPFAFAFLFAAVRGVSGPRWGVAAGAAAGLSLWWQTDIGIFTVVAGVALYAANALFLGGSAWRVATFTASSAGAFFAICLMLFGPRVLSPLFCQRLVEPLLLYGTGFGNQLFNWEAPWGVWYNLVGPCVGVAAVGAWIGSRRGEVTNRATVYAACASLLGLAMLIKWVNRSIDVVWSLNGGLIVAVAGCWAWAAWRAACDQLASTGRPVLGYARQAAAAAVVMGLAVWAVREDRAAANPKWQGGSSSPLVRVADRLDTAPNAINAARKKLVAKPAAVPLDTNTVTFLRAYTAKTERVAVVAPLDWEYLAAAGRAPKLHWVQLFLVHSPVLLDRCAADVRDSEVVFVHCDALVSLNKVNPKAYEKVAGVLAEHFGDPEWTPCQWHLYHRKSGRLAKR